MFWGSDFWWTWDPENWSTMQFWDELKHTVVDLCIFREDWPTQWLFLIWRGGGETPNNHGALKLIVQYLSSCHREIDPHNGSVCPHSGYLCCEGEGREPLINMEPLKLFSSSFLRGIYPHSGSVYPYNGCLCYEGVEGETPDNHEALKVVLQYSSSYHRGIDPHRCCWCPHRDCCIVNGGEGTLINMGALKLFSSGPPGTLEVVC